MCLQEPARSCRRIEMYVVAGFAPEGLYADRALVQFFRAVRKVCSTAKASKTGWPARFVDWARIRTPGPAPSEPADRFGQR